MPKFLERITAQEFSAASSAAIDASVDGDSNARIQIDAGGKITWGPGNASGDATLYRSAANILKTDDTLEAALGVITLATDGAPSTALANGALAVDTTNDTFYFRSSGSWQEVSGGGASLTVSDTAPGSPEAGNLWFESDTGRTLVYYADGSSNQWVEIGLASSGASGTDGKIQFSESDSLASDTLLHWDNTNNRLGVGTASPGYPLDVSGTSRFTGAITASGGVVGNVTGNASGTALTVTQAAQSAITSVGTLTGLTVSGNITVTDGTSPQMILKDTGAADENSAPSGGFQVVANNGNTALSVGIDSSQMKFTCSDLDAPMLWRLKDGTGTNTRMTLTAAGKVGIGTTSPIAALSVTSGTANAYGTAVFGRYEDEGLFLHGAGSSSHYNWLIAQQENVDTGLEFTPSTAVGGTTFSTPAMAIRANGRVGLGVTNPGLKLHVYTTASTDGILLDGSTFPAITLQGAGTTRGYIGVATGNGGFVNNSVTGDLIIRSDSTKLHLATSQTAASMTFSGTNVGIGTSSPAHPLHVDGFARFDADAGEWGKIYGGGSAGDGAWAQYYDSAGNHMGYVGFPANEDLHLQANCTSPASQIFFRTNSVYCSYITSDGYFFPYTDNVFRFGDASHRWNHVVAYDVYSHDGSVHTSEASEKTDVIDTPLGVDFIKELRPVQYRWIDGTRSHQGFIAQDVETVLDSTAGTTASAQGMWCVEQVDTTTDVNEEVLDDDGNVVGVERTTVPGEQFERQSLRYNELMAPMVKALQEIVTRLEVLESA